MPNSDPWMENENRIKFLEQQLSILEDLLYESIDYIDNPYLVYNIECVLDSKLANK